MLRLRTRPEGKTKPAFQINGKKKGKPKFPADWQDTPFNRLTFEALQVSKQVDALEGDNRLSVDAWVNETLEIGGGSMRKVKRLQLALVDPQVPHFEATRATYRRMQSAIKGPNLRTPPQNGEALDRLFRWLGTPASDSELRAKRFANTELFACALLKVAETNPELFGKHESSDGYADRYEGLLAKRNELWSRMGGSYTADDLIVGPLDSQGKATVTWKLSGGAVPIYPDTDAPKRLIEHLIRKENDSR